ncbi:hypothetical protein P7D22_19890 [Lichenihabitans sp. Uapishka_5]|uniref:hypothetical protein n=1 Tax=Lichenihabitans sp. Uapishka_5 TaxID=3037302 RepID=UPI0029E7E0C5|nr:hypothetical protein [Lichenihabitans sp. Uapishka_5]MDX7953430.1 hypothetical protein [Lichenihabitans sp. Uapishka_5]
MKVYIANFGRENYEWPVCKSRGTVATMNDVGIQPLWAAGNREGYLQRAMLGKTAAGISPPKTVASRWFNLMTIIAETEHDLWIHRQKDELWWTVSTAAPPAFEEKVEPVGDRPTVVVCHKPCGPWSDLNRAGNRLDWNALHPKAKEFLFTEGTLQALGPDNADYALALVNGDDLSRWHSRPEWKKKTTAKIGKGGPGTIYNGRQKAAWRMADTAMKTVAHSNGQQVLSTMKNKDLGFASQIELEKYIIGLLDIQEGICALTDLPYYLDGDTEDRAMLCSLDRIDSSGHYARGNLQIVCRFANEWKGSRDNADFRRLIGAVRSVQALS